MGPNFASRHQDFTFYLPCKMFTFTENRLSIFSTATRFLSNPENANKYLLIQITEKLNLL